MTFVSALVQHSFLGNNSAKPLARMEPLGHLLSVPLSLSPNGAALSILAHLKSVLPDDIVVNSPVWDSLRDQTRSSRNVLESHWCSNEEFSSHDNTYARAAISCFDFLNSFVRAASQTEKIHISAFLAIKDHEGNQATSDGDSLTIPQPLPDQPHPDSEPEAPCSSMESLPDPDFNGAAALIMAVKNLNDKIKEYKEDPDISATVVMIDVNVMEDLRFERSAEDNHEVIALALVTGHILLRLAGLDSDGSFIKVQTDCPVTPGDEPTGKILVSARWPGKPPSVLMQAHNLRRAWKGDSENFFQLQNVITSITDKEGRRNIVLLGRTGSGKSYTGNWILRHLCRDESVQFMESESGSMTSFVEKLPKNGYFCVWDTPGLDDAYGRDQRYLDDIEKSILEMGTVSAIILCFSSIQRVEGSVQRQIAAYAKIIGPELSRRLLLFINRQPGSVTSMQKRNLIKYLKQEGLTVAKEQIFDMGSYSSDIEGSMQAASTVLLKHCAQPGMKMSYVDKLHQGLLEIQKLQNSQMREHAEDVLIKLSSELLWFKFGSKNRKRPLALMPSLRTSFVVLSDRCRYKVDGERIFIEHVIELPDSARTLLNAWKVFTNGFGPRDYHVYKLVELVTRLRLVFLELPADRRTNRRYRGLRSAALKIQYKLWNVSEALAEDVKQHIQKATGLAGETTVSAFPHLCQ